MVMPYRASISRLGIICSCGRSTALFVVSRVGNIQFKTLVKGVLPFLLPLIITLILLNVFPQITLFLPTLLTGGV